MQSKFCTLPFQIRPQICRCTKIDMVDFRLCTRHIGKQEHTDTAWQTVVYGTLACIKERHKIKSVHTTDTGCWECRSQIFGYTEDGCTDVGRRDGVGGYECCDKLLCCLPDFYASMLSTVKAPRMPRIALTLLYEHPR